MKTQNTLLKLLLVTTITLILSACNSKTNQEETNTSTIQNPTTQTTEDASTDGGSDANATGGTDDNTNTRKDVTPPVLTLNGEASVTLEQNAPYSELGATAVDAVDGNVTVTITGNVDTSMVGSYTVTYSATDSAGNEANITRAITVIDVTPPVITLNGQSNITLEQDAVYTELGATALDAVDGNVSVTISGTVDTSTVGSYTVTYTAQDQAGNEANSTRSIRVIDVTPPELTLNGEVNITLEQNAVYTELGATALDGVDGNVSVTTTGTVDTSTVGSYTVTYTAQDSVGNEANITRSVEVINTTPTLSSITLESNATTVNVGEMVQLSVVGKYSDGSNAVDKNITYTITPNDSAEMNGSVLIAKKDGNVTVQATVGGVNSNTIALTITWVVDGHVLPPEPDPAVNNATLGGVDSNDNGVRDDVERNIYAKYTIPIERVILLNKAQFYQKTMIEPVENSPELVKFSIKLGNCSIHLKHIGYRANEWRENREYIKNISFNNTQRIRKYLDYNIALSGGSYGSSPRDWNREACSNDVIEVLEGMGL